jgi:hypothetical protein
VEPEPVWKSASMSPVTPPAGGATRALAPRPA